MTMAKDLAVTLLIGLLSGGMVIALSTLLGVPVPAPHHRPVFLIGSALLASCFRLLGIFREENPEEETAPK